MRTHGSQRSQRSQAVALLGLWKPGAAQGLGLDWEWDDMMGKGCNPKHGGSGKGLAGRAGFRLSTRARRGTMAGSVMVILACLAQSLDPEISFQSCNIVVDFKQLMIWLAFPRAKQGPASGEETSRG